MIQRLNKFALFLALGLTIAGAASVITASAKTTARDVAQTYSNIALAGYQDSLTSAQALRGKIADFVAHPTQDSLSAARTAWIAARVPYMQTEAFRFGNKIVDDWEGKVNAWPLDEGLIDYVDGVYGAEHPENALYVSNVIANTSLKISGKNVDTSKITKEFLSDSLHEAGGVEANVATGYHAIEFLLWGQDLNGTGPGAGKRPATDFDLKNCTGGNCDRRVAYLQTATDLLIDDLKYMVAQWSDAGGARADLAKISQRDLLATIFTGLGSLSYGEMAGERVKLGLMLHDPEEEHDCFSDNTHNSHYYDIVGIQNVYTGTYTRTDGSKVSGASLSDVVREASSETDAKIRTALEQSVAKAGALKTRAETTEAYDQMLAQGNAAGNAAIMAVVESLVAQTKAFESALAVLKLDPIAFEGSDSLDNPNAVD